MSGIYVHVCIWVVRGAQWLHGWCRGKCSVTQTCWNHNCIVFSDWCMLYDNDRDPITYVPCSVNYQIDDKEVRDPNTRVLCQWINGCYMTENVIPSHVPWPVNWWVLYDRGRDLITHVLLLSCCMLYDRPWSHHICTVFSELAILCRVWNTPCTV